MNFVVDTFLVKIFVFINNKWIDVRQVSMNFLLGTCMNVSFGLLSPENYNLII